MKTRIFKSTSKSGKSYWSISATNYKDKEDKGTYFISFGKDCVEPMPLTGTTQSGKTYQYADIDILECKFNWFNGAPSIFVSKCTQKDGAVEKKIEEKNKVEIQQDDLPFFGG